LIAVLQLPALPGSSAGLHGNSNPFSRSNNTEGVSALSPFFPALTALALVTLSATPTRPANRRWGIPCECRRCQPGAVRKFLATASIKPGRTCSARKPSSPRTRVVRFPAPARGQFCLAGSMGRVVRPGHRGSRCPRPSLTATVPDAALGNCSMRALPSSIRGVLSLAALVHPWTSAAIDFLSLAALVHPWTS
jgi:hypothetical protein